MHIFNNYTNQLIIYADFLKMASLRFYSHFVQTIKSQWNSNCLHGFFISFIFNFLSIPLVDNIFTWFKFQKGKKSPSYPASQTHISHLWRQQMLSVGSFRIFPERFYILAIVSYHSIKFSHFYKGCTVFHCVNTHTLFLYW